MLDYQDMLVILGKNTKVSHFIKARVNDRTNIKLMILWYSTILKGLTINCLNV